MQQGLIDRSEDLKRLLNDGYSLEVRSGHALVHEIPYVNAQKELKRGTLVSPLELAGDMTARPTNHVVFFRGDAPCNIDGTIIMGIQHQSGMKDLGDGIQVHHSFSNKPVNGFSDYYDKFVNYINIISAPAHLIDDGATARVYNVVPSHDYSVFNYFDTNSSRANIGSVSDKLRGQRIGIVGLGGTGSYVLDMVAKTSVAEIHVFDGDLFYQHNAFRAPGAPSRDELECKAKKVEHFSSIYGHMHKGIVAHDVFLGEDGLDCLPSLDFVFLCIDAGMDKRIIVDSLVSAGRPFIDTGVGVDLIDGSLSAIVRTTAVTDNTRGDWRRRLSFGEAGGDLYASNIQVAELNALCAVLAVLKWKKINGVYREQNQHDFVGYDVSMGEVVSEN